MSTRTALLDAAEHAVRRRGFDAFSYADLSRAVGIRKASIHHHFPAKADLAHALISRYRESFAVTLDAIAEKHDTAGARLGAFVDSYRSAMTGGETVCLCVAFSTGRDSFEGPVLAELEAFNADCIAWLITAFALAQRDKSVTGAGAADAEARACLALVGGAQLIARAAKDPNRYDQATALFRSRLVETE